MHTNQIDHRIYRCHIGEFEDQIYSSGYYLSLEHALLDESVLSEQNLTTKDTFRNYNDELYLRPYCFYQYGKITPYWELIDSYCHTPVDKGRKRVLPVAYRKEPVPYTGRGKRRRTWRNVGYAACRLEISRYEEDRLYIPTLSITKERENLGFEWDGAGLSHSRSWKSQTKNRYQWM